MVIFFSPTSPSVRSILTSFTSLQKSPAEKALLNSRKELWMVKSWIIGEVTIECLQINLKFERALIIVWRLGEQHNAQPIGSMFISGLSSSQYPLKAKHFHGIGKEGKFFLIREFNKVGQSQRNSGASCLTKTN